MSIINPAETSSRVDAELNIAHFVSRVRRLKGDEGGAIKPEFIIGIDEEKRDSA